MSERKAYYMLEAQSEHPCDLCEGLEGQHDELPVTHPNCACTITRITGSQRDTFVSSQYDVKIVGYAYDHLGTVQDNVDLNVGEEESVFAQIGEIFAVGSSRTTTKGSTVHYDEKVGGEIQDVYQQYIIYEGARTVTWRRSDGSTYQETEVTGQLREEGPIITIPQGELPYSSAGSDIGAGEAEVGGEDQSGEEEDQSGEE